MFAKCVIQFEPKQIYSWHIYCLMQYVWRVSLVSLLLYTSNIVSMQHIHQYKSLCIGCKSKLELVLEALYTYTPIPDSYNPNLQNAVYVYAKIMWYNKFHRKVITFWLWNKKTSIQFCILYYSFLFLPNERFREKKKLRKQKHTRPFNLQPLF